jgi:hypothetical protein
MLKDRKIGMSATPKMAREKLSTTVSAETHRFLQEMIEQGEVASLAEAVDAVVDRIKRIENRRRLANATAKYFAQLPAQAEAEEQEIGQDLSAAAGAIDFDAKI